MTFNNMDDIDIYGDLDNFDAKVELGKNTEELNALREKYESLLKENKRLEKRNKKLEEAMINVKFNFNSLIETARAEIARKDAQITELRKERDNIVFRRGNRGPVESRVENTSKEPQRISETARDSSNVIPKEVNRRPSLERETKQRDDRRLASKDDNRSEDLREDRSGKRNGNSTQSRDGSNKERERTRQRKRSRSPDHKISTKKEYRRRSRERSRERRRNTRSPDRRERSYRDKDNNGRHRRDKRHSPPNYNDEPKAPAEKRRKIASATEIFRDQSNSSAADSTNVNQHKVKDTQMPTLPVVKPEAGWVGPPPPLPSEPVQPRPPEPLISFAGSLERLKKEGMLINVDCRSNSADLEPPSLGCAPPVSEEQPQISRSPQQAKLEETVRSNTPSVDIPENSLRLSVDLKSSPASMENSQIMKTPATQSPPQTQEEIYPSPDSDKPKQCGPSTSLVQNSPLHPHLMVSQDDHLPMMVVPSGAVITPIHVHEELETLPVEKAKTPPPKPKIHTVAGNRTPYLREEKTETVPKEPSNLTKENLDARNEEQERHKLEYLRAEILLVAGPKLASDPSLQESFKRKEEEEERKKLAGRAKPEGMAMSVCSTHKNGNLEAVRVSGNMKRESVDGMDLTVHKAEESTPSVISEPVKEQCIIMGNSKYNITQNSEGKKVMIVSRLKKKRRVVPKP